MDIVVQDGIHGELLLVVSIRDFKDQSEWLAVYRVYFFAYLGCDQILAT